MIRIVFLIVLVFISPANATPCWLIKASYAPFAAQGIKAAEKWARSHGYSEAAIREARKCLEGK
jgi:hypothetical protein